MVLSTFQVRRIARTFQRRLPLKYIEFLCSVNASFSERFLKIPFQKEIRMFILLSEKLVTRGVDWQLRRNTHTDAYHCKNRRNRVNLKDLKLTYHIVATVTQTASGRWWQLVHEEGATVLNPGINRPMAWVIKASTSSVPTGPMKTHFAHNNPFSHCRMPAPEPTSRMRTTLIYWHNLSRHLCACSSCEPVPGLDQGVVTPSNQSWVTVFHLAIKFGQVSMFDTS